jgi:ABC-type multidrug transport system ATPase subunit
MTTQAIHVQSDAGTAAVDGFDVATQAADVRESISLTGQFAAVDETLTGRGSLVLVARLRRVEGPGQVADDCWPASSSSTRPSGGWRRIRAACAAWTSP